MKVIHHNQRVVRQIFLGFTLFAITLFGVFPLAYAQQKFIDHESPPELFDETDFAILQPNPQYTPDEVVRFQLEALSQNNDPHNNAGIELVFRFASPANKETTGPLRRFARIVYNPLYRPLLNHQRAHYGELREDGDKAAQLVVLTSRSGKRMSYLFMLSRQEGGHYDECWMTDAVWLLPGLQDV
jgi:hypothetical protein